MKSCRIYLLYFGLFSLVLGLVVSGLFLAQNYRQRRQAQLRSDYYQTILVQAPCIAGICPGMAGRNAAYELLAADAMVGRIYNSDEVSMGFRFASSSVDPRSVGHVFFARNSPGHYQIVEKISLTLLGLNLATVTEALGEPDEFLFIAGCGGKGYRSHARLFYTHRGVDVEVQFAGRTAGSKILTENTYVSRIQYFSPDQYQEHVVSALNFALFDNPIAYTLPPSLTVQELSMQIRPWVGFGAQPTVNYCMR
jgi:hypothetical protein